MTGARMRKTWVILGAVVALVGTALWHEATYRTVRPARLTPVHPAATSQPAPPQPAWPQSRNWTAWSLC